MEFLLGKVTQQAMNYAIKSGVTLTASYAIKQSTKLLQNAPESNVTKEFADLQQVSFPCAENGAGTGSLVSNR